MVEVGGTLMQQPKPTIAYRIDSETPSDAALTAVAAVVRLSDFAMRVVPAFALAMALSVRTSSFVHTRRVIFLANSRISNFNFAERPSNCEGS